MATPAKASEFAQEYERIRKKKTQDVKRLVQTAVDCGIPVYILCRNKTEFDAAKDHRWLIIGSNLVSIGSIINETPPETLLIELADLIDITPQ